MSDKAVFPLEHGCVCLAASEILQKQFQEVLDIRLDASRATRTNQRGYCKSLDFPEVNDSYKARGYVFILLR